MTVETNYLYGEIKRVAVLGLSPRTTVDVKDIITLEAIRQMEMTGDGRFYIDAEGKAVYKSRFARSG